MPRTSLHLRELYSFLSGAEDKSFGYGLSKKKLTQLRKELNPSKVHLNTELLDYVSADLDGREFNMLEDGILLLSAKGKHIIKAREDLNNFFLKKFQVAFSYIYSRGAPIPKTFSSISSVPPTVVVTSKAGKREINALFKKLGDQVQQEYPGRNTNAYFGKNLIVLAGDVEEDLELVRYLIFMFDYHVQQRRMLKVHRTVWDEAARIREKQKVNYSDLPIARDLLLDLKKDISYFEARLEQMTEYINVRSENIETLLAEGQLRTRISEELKSYKATQTYLGSLMKMTEDFVDQTLSLVELLYQENEQKEINTLQVIFIVGVITSLIALGAMPGAFISVMNQAGDILYTAELESFSFMDLAKWGPVALVLGAIVYYLLHIGFTRLKKFRVVDVSKIRGKSGKSIQEKLD
ncbi:hypothetical protein ACFL2D_01335 [Patescibacteria group bacterium]